MNLLEPHGLLLRVSLLQEAHAFGLLWVCTDCNVSN